MAPFRADKPTRQIDRFPAEPWFVDVVDVSGSGLNVQGWTFIDKRRPDGDYSARFSFNGRPFDSVFYPLVRKEVGDLFPARKDADQCGFILTAFDVGNPSRDGVLETRARKAGSPDSRNNSRQRISGGDIARVLRRSWDNFAEYFLDWAA